MHESNLIQTGRRWQNKRLNALLQLRSQCNDFFLFFSFCHNSSPNLSIDIQRSPKA
uniref:Uncharacterized protein n=1 Tax=Rhizophora mucronata TaxID=61149 RepID=A0A2P2PI78_RHIMU